MTDFQRAVSTATRFEVEPHNSLKIAYQRSKFKTTPGTFSFTFQVEGELNSMLDEVQGALKMKQVNCQRFMNTNNSKHTYGNTLRPENPNVRTSLPTQMESSD